MFLLTVCVLAPRSKCLPPEIFARYDQDTQLPLRPVVVPLDVGMFEKSKKLIVRPTSTLHQVRAIFVSIRLAQQLVKLRLQPAFVFSAINGAHLRPTFWPNGIAHESSEFC